MRNNRLLANPLLFLFLLMVIFAAPTRASQVKFITFSSASGGAGSNVNGIRLTFGQSVAGTAKHVAGNSMAGLGIWEILKVYGETSAVDGEIPKFGDHLFSNYPNPFNPSTKINFSIREEARVLLEVYDLKGRKVDTLVQEVKPAGDYSITYQPKNLASGTYLVLMRAGSYRASQRMMLLK